MYRKKYYQSISTTLVNMPGRKPVRIFVEMTFLKRRQAIVPLTQELRLGVRLGQKNFFATQKMLPLNVCCQRLCTTLECVVTKFCLMTFRLDRI